mmetsp:Transcript_49934/g.53909  ORF Transcript_49934/g.53909 Transcript_49934/m.53909 type:complete len:524 (-) Transcript_49934:507-2078(-)
MITMMMGRKFSQVVLFVFGLLAVAFLSSHSTVDATTLSKHDNSLNRRPTRKVRGAKRDLGVHSIEKNDDHKIGSKPNSKSNTRGKSNTGEKSNTREKSTHRSSSHVSRPIRSHVSLDDINKLGTHINENEFEKQEVQSEKSQGSSIEKKEIREEKNDELKHNRNGSNDVEEDQEKTNDEGKRNRNRSNDVDVEENGAEHFQKVDVEVYRRQVPKFSIHFAIENTDKPPNMADYNELSEVSEEYLDSFFRSVFKDLQVRHDGTILFVSVNEDDPFTVDFVVTLAFIIPGEVPTVNYLIDGLQDGLESDTSMAFFVSDLSTMSKTNPFSKTMSIEVVSRPPVSETEMKNDGENSPSGVMTIKSKNILISFFAGIGFFIFVVAGFMWVKKRRFNKNAISEPDQTFALFDKPNNNKNKSADLEFSGVYGADDETMSYLNSIRKRYKDHDEKNSRDSKITKKPSALTKSNTSTVEVAGSFDHEEDSMCDTASTGSQNDGQERKERADVDYLNLELNSSDVEDDLRSIY